MNKEKGGLIKKKAPIMRPAVTVTKKQDADFGFDVPVKKETKKSSLRSLVGQISFRMLKEKNSLTLKQLLFFNTRPRGMCPRKTAEYLVVSAHGLKTNACES